MATINVAMPCGDGNDGNLTTGRHHRYPGFLINFTCRICILPIPLSNTSSGGTSVRAKGARKVICVFLHSAVILYQLIFHIYPQTRRYFDRGDPKLMFNLAYQATSLGVTLSAVHTVWYRREVLERLLNDSASLKGTFCRHHCVRNLLLTVIIFGTLLLSVTHGIFPRPTQEMGIRRSLAFLGCDGPSNHSLVSGENIWVDLLQEDNGCFVRKVGTLSFLFLRLGMYVLRAQGYCRLLLFSAVVYRFVVTKSNLINTESQAGYTFNVLMERYGKCKRKIGLLNRTAPLSLVFITVQFVMHAAMFVPSTTEWKATGIVISTMLVNSGTLLLAAEINRRMREAERYVISKFPLNVSAHAATYLANMDGDSGLSGGSFFTITYPCLGSMVTAIFTYILVVQQLQVSN